MLGRRTSAVRERVGVLGGLHRSRARAQVDEEAVHGIWGDKRGTGNGRRTRAQGVRDHRNGYPRVGEPMIVPSGKGK
jgi:hypothetical protein